MGKVTYRQCPLCQEEHGVLLSNEQFERYEECFVNGRQPIQNILPELGVVEREFLITGYCYRCQTLIFGTVNKPNLTLWT